jgi:hypothetical protein
VPDAKVESDRNPVRRPAAKVAASPWGARALRAGLAARGVVFLVLGYLVARVAFGALGSVSSSSKPAELTGVPPTLAAHSGGRVALFVLAIGLVLYAVFSLVDALLHHDDENPKAKRWGDRLLSLWGFVMYCAFSAYCFETAIFPPAGKTAGQTDRQKTQWSSTVLRWPGGAVWLGLAGAVLLVIFGFLVSRAARRSFRPRLHRERMSRRTWLVAMVLGVAGYLGRAALFGIVGGCILSAAVENDPDHGQGVDGSARILADSPAGAVFLGFVAALLITYGAYLFVEMRYRHV